MWKEIYISFKKRNIFPSFGSSSIASFTSSSTTIAGCLWAVADTGISQTGGVGLLFGMKNEVYFGHKRTLILIGF